MSANESAAAASPPHDVLDLSFDDDDVEISQPAASFSSSSSSTPAPAIARASSSSSQPRSIATAQDGTAAAASSDPIELDSDVYQSDDNDDDDDDDVDVDDDELMILKVRRALHIPLHPVRKVHSPVDLRDEDEEEEENKKQQHTKQAGDNTDEQGDQKVGAEEESEDVCSICLSVPTDLTTPSSCQHPFCWNCLEQWTRIQLMAIYESQERERWAAIPGFQPAGHTTKKKHPSCPMCKRDYQALNKRFLGENQTAPTAALPASSSSSSSSNLPSVTSSVPVTTILPPPSSFHQPTLTIQNAQFSNNEYFRLAGEAGLQFALRTAPGLPAGVLSNILQGHPRMNSLLRSYPPYREPHRFPEVQAACIQEIIRTRAIHLRREAVQLREQQRQQALRMDHGGGIEQVPLMTDANAHMQLVQRLSPFGSAVMLAASHSREVESTPTNPILQLYRESRYKGAMTSFLGRLRLWSDLKRIEFIPAQPDVIWTLKQAGIGQGVTRALNLSQQSVDQMLAANSVTAQANNSAAAAAADQVDAAGASTTQARYEALKKWLNTELYSLLSATVSSPTGSERTIPSTDHFLTLLVLGFLEVLLVKLTVEEKERASKKHHRVQRKKKTSNNATVTASSAVVIDDDSASASSSAAAAAVPPLNRSFVPSYFSESSSLHPVSTSAPSQLDIVTASSSPPAAAAATNPSSSPPRSSNDSADDVILVSDHRPSASPSSSPRDVVIIADEEEDNAIANEAAGTASAAVSSPSPAAEVSELVGSAVSSRSVAAGGHLHTLFALSTPLTSAVDFLHGKLEEFLKGFTAVFVHRLFLFILAQSYNNATAGPARTDERYAVQLEAVAEKSGMESQLKEVLEQARKKWVAVRETHIQGQRPVTTFVSTNVPLSATSGSNSEQKEDYDLFSLVNSPFGSMDQSMQPDNSVDNPNQKRRPRKRKQQASASPTDASPSPPSLLNAVFNSSPPVAAAAASTSAAAAATELDRRYADEDPRLASGMMSVKRPRPSR